MSDSIAPITKYKLGRVDTAKGTYYIYTYKVHKKGTGHSAPKGKNHGR